MPRGVQQTRVVRGAGHGGHTRRGHRDQGGRVRGDVEGVEVASLGDREDGVPGGGVGGHHAGHTLKGHAGAGLEAVHQEAAFGQHQQPPPVLQRPGGEDRPGYGHYGGAALLHAN